MATNKSRAPSKPKQPNQNTSAAPVPGNSADVPATEVAKAASQAIAPDAGQSASDEARSIPPVGDKKVGDPVVTALIIASKVEGFRRAGRPWSRESQTVLIGEFSKDQIEALLNEPMLDVATATGG